MSDAVLARRLERLCTDLRRSEDQPAALVHALDQVGRALERLRRTYEEDEALSLRLGASRATAASYVRATVHLSEAGADIDLCEDVLRRGRARVMDELGEVQQSLLAGQAPGAR